VISLLVWRTADTRESEFRAKVIKYSVEGNGAGAWSSFDDKDDVVGDDESVIVDIANVGSLPVNAVTLSIRAETPDNKPPKVDVQLAPAIDHEVLQQGDVSVIRFRNALAPGEHVKADMTFSASYHLKSAIRKGLELEQAYVDSEVGAATLVASLEKPDKRASEKK
jgi:hypothetical protein